MKIIRLYKFFQSFIKSLLIQLKLVPFYFSYSFVKVLNIINPPKIDYKYWSNVKKKIRSNTFLVVANGPSLNFKDLEKLSHLPSIASNKIYLGFDGVNWRPTLWTISDSLLAYKFSKSKIPYKGILNCSSNIYYLLSKKFNVKSWKRIEYNKISSMNNAVIHPVFSGIFEGATITFINIQLAIWLGAKTIYLTGLDHYYNEEFKPIPGQKVNNSHRNHFHPEYRKKNEIVNSAPIDILNANYKLINNYAKKRDIKIINISRKTYCNEFNRTSIHDAIKQEKK